MTEPDIQVVPIEDFQEVEDGNIQPSSSHANNLVPVHETRDQDNTGPQVEIDIENLEVFNDDDIPKSSEDVEVVTQSNIIDSENNFPYDQDDIVTDFEDDIVNLVEVNVHTTETDSNSPHPVEVTHGNEEEIKIEEMVISCESQTEGTKDCNDVKEIIEKKGTKRKGICLEDESIANSFEGMYTCDTVVAKTRNEEHNVSEGRTTSRLLDSQVQCVNLHCQSGYGLEVAPVFVLTYFGQKRKKNILQKVCKECFKMAFRHQQDVIYRLKAHKSVLKADFPPLKNDVVVMDHVEEEYEEDLLSDEVVTQIRQYLPELLVETLQKYDLDFQLNQASKILDKKFKRLEDSTKVIDNEFNSLEKELWESRLLIYKDFSPNIRALPPLTIMESSVTPEIGFQGNSDKITSTGNKSPVSESGGESSTQDIVAVEMVEVPKKKLPPTGPLVYPLLRTGDKVYVMRANLFSSWVKGKILEIINENPEDIPIYRVRIENSQRGPVNRIVCGKYLAYSKPSPVRYPVGTRIIALFNTLEPPSKSAFYAGLIAEPPKHINKFRYLVFFDDGFAYYVPHEKIHLICESSQSVYEDVHPESKEFIKKYLERYPERPMVKLLRGQIVRTEWKGRWWLARVMELDCSLAKMRFDADGRTEWIYRGSTRLGPLYSELVAATNKKAMSSGSRRRSVGSSSMKKRNGLFVGDHSGEHSDEHGGEHSDEHGGEHGGGHGAERGSKHGGGHGGERGSKHGGERGGEHGGEHGSKHGGKHGSKHGAEHSSKHGSEHGSKLGAEHGSKHGAEHGSKHGAEHSSKHGCEHGSKHGAEHSSKHGAEHGTKHGAEHGTKHGGEHSIKHGGEHGTKHGAEHSSKHGGEHGTKHGAEHSSKHGGEHGTKHGVEHSSKHGAEHSTKHGGEQCTKHGAEHSTKHGAEHGTKHGAEHGTKHGAEHSSKDGGEHGTKHGAEHSIKHGGEHGSKHVAEHSIKHGGEHGGEHGSKHGAEHSSKHGDEHGGEHGSKHGAEHSSKHGAEHSSKHGGEHGGEHGSKHGGKHGGEHGREHSGDRDDSKGSHSSGKHGKKKSSSKSSSQETSKDHKGKDHKSKDHKTGSPKPVDGMEYLTRGYIRSIDMSARVTGKVFTPHQCGPRCTEWTKYSMADCTGMNPLALPLHFGFERQFIKHKGKRSIMYRAPCGRRLRTMVEVHRYLRITKTSMGVEFFDFDTSIHVLDEFYLDSDMYQIFLKDVSYGLEKNPVTCVNEIDHSWPTFMDYSTLRIPQEDVKICFDEEFLVNCDCDDDCQDKTKCDCWKLTIEGTKSGARKVPDSSVGYKFKRLLEPVTTGIYECNHKCKCAASCLNRVAQRPFQLNLQVFKTLKKGWGLRAVNDIPQGGFICIYAGRLHTEKGANVDGSTHGDEYMAELDYIEVVEKFKEGYESEVVEPGEPGEKVEEDEEGKDIKSNDADDKDYIPEGLGKLPPTQSVVNTRARRRRFSMKQKSESESTKEKEKMSLQPLSEEERRKRSVRVMYGDGPDEVYVMDAKSIGNIGRYLNHSCQPNVFVQNVFVDSHDLRFPWVAFFALTQIKAGTELTWDYNYEVGSVENKVLQCYCNKAECRGRLL